MTGVGAHTQKRRPRRMSEPALPDRLARNQPARGAVTVMRAAVSFCIDFFTVITVP
jgi:hypothetical protein